MIDATEVEEKKPWRGWKEGEREVEGRKEEGAWGDEKLQKGTQGPAPGGQVKGQESEQGKAGK